MRQRSRGAHPGRKIQRRQLDCGGSRYCLAQPASILWLQIHQRLRRVAGTGGAKRAVQNKALSNQHSAVSKTRVALPTWNEMRKVPKQAGLKRPFHGFVDYWALINWVWPIADYGLPSANHESYRQRRYL